MSDDLVLPVPESVEAVYVVPTSRPPDDPAGTALVFVFDKVAEPLKGVVLHAVGDGSCLVTTRSAGEVPPLPAARLRAFGADPALVESAAGASSMITVSTACRPHERPQAEHVARAVALGIATAVGAPVVDAFLPRLVTIDELAAGVDANFATCVADLVLVLQSTGPTGTRMSTKGLGRFGLPEIEARDVPSELSRPMTNLLTGLAGVVVTALVESPVRSAFLTLGATVRVDQRDVARAFGQAAGPVSQTGRAMPTADVPLTLRPADAREHGGSADPYLAIVPPSSFDGSSGEFYATILAEVLGR